MADDQAGYPQKHNCPDCKSCQWRSDSKCRMYLIYKPKPNPDKPESNKEPLMDANKREYGADLIFKDEVFH